MAASVVLLEYTDPTVAAEANNNGTTGTDRFVASDPKVRLQANNAGTEVSSPQPVVKGASTVYSMERWLRMRAASGIVVSLTNPKFFSANTSWGTDLTPYDRTTATGATPIAPSDATGFTTMHTHLTGNRLPLGTYTVTTTPKWVGDFLILMMGVGTNAATGNQPAGYETITFAYDEA